MHYLLETLQILPKILIHYKYKLSDTPSYLVVQKYC